MIEFEGKIFDRTVSVLVDPGATLSYVSPKIVENCKLQLTKFKHPWLVQLATGAKRRVLAKLEKRWFVIKWKIEIISYEDELGNKQEIQGILKPVQVRPITASQLAKSIRKKCQIYAVQVGLTSSKDKGSTLEDISVVREFADVFPEEIPGLPLKRNLDFTIELVLDAAPVSRAPYRMSIPELTELKMQL
eukprot:PITA_33989